MKKYVYFVCLFLLRTGFAFVNLEVSPQDFILETKRIEIPGYSSAFNPSIVWWKGAILMSFRSGGGASASDSPLVSVPSDDCQPYIPNQIGFIFLNCNFEPISEPYLLEMLEDNPFFLVRHQDPRLIAVGTKMYLVYNNMTSGLHVAETRRMLVAQLHFDGKKFSISSPECLSRFEGETEQRWQKNWVPFDYRGALLLSYTIAPHKVLYPLLGTGSCETVCTTQAAISWPWGQIRGGTPALLVDGEYLAFFHSSKEMKTEHSEGKKISHYFMGAYTFSATPPFALTRISPSPLIAKGFYTGPAYQTWKPLRVVFPTGFIFDHEYIWVSYGKQDHEVWIAKIDKQKLLSSLSCISAQ